MNGAPKLWLGHPPVVAEEGVAAAEVAEEAVPVIEVSASRFGQAAEHIADAQAAGQPSMYIDDRQTWS